MQKLETLKFKTKKMFLKENIFTVLHKLNAKKFKYRENEAEIHRRCKKAV